MKNCIKCNIEKKITHFYKQKRNRDGFTLKCKSCINDEKKQYYNINKENILIKNKKYGEINKIYLSEKRKEYYEENKDQLLKKNKEYYQNNKEYLSKKHIEYYYVNKDEISNRNKNNRDILNYKVSQKKKYDKLYSLKESIRSRIVGILKSNNFKKTSKTEEILGCTFEEFKLYLEGKFEPWMTWENRGLYNGELNYGWDIDHVIPLSSVETEDEIVNLNHYTNLQPLCSKINRDIKRDKINWKNE
jgi:hypothetical protein